MFAHMEHNASMTRLLGLVRRTIDCAASDLEKVGVMPPQPS